MIGKIVAGMMELGARFTGKAPALTRALLDDYGRRYQFLDASSTKADFHWIPIAYEETIRDTIDWLFKINAVDRSVLNQTATTKSIS